MGFEFYQEYEFVQPEYRAVIHELRDPEGTQMLVLHIDVHQFKPSVMKRMIHEFKTFRSCTDAPLFAIEPSPDDAKWHRFVSHLGFRYSSRVECTDGLTRRCYVSTAGAVSKKKNNDDLKHFITEQ